MEELEQALLFLLYTIFSELSFSLPYKVFGKTDRKSWIRIKNYRTDLSLPIFVTVLFSLQNPHSSCVWHSTNHPCDYTQAFSLCWKKVLLYSTTRQLLHEDRQTSTFLSKTRRISKARIFLVWLQQVLSLLHRRIFLGMSHLTWDPTPARGSAATKLCTIVHCHQLPKETGLGCRTTGSWCLRRKAASWSPTMMHSSNNICSALPSSHLQRKALRGTSKRTYPAILHQVCLKSSCLGRTPTRGLTTARQWVR